MTGRGRWTERSRQGRVADEWEQDKVHGQLLYITFLLTIITHLGAMASRDGI